MSRKEGGIGFYVSENPNPDKKDTKKYYHVRQAASSAMTSDELKELIVNSTTITEADYEGFVEALKSFIPDVLKSGRSVHIEGIGTFFLKMRIAERRDEDGNLYKPRFERPDDITARDVAVTGVGFRADKQFNERATRVSGFVRERDMESKGIANREQWLKGLEELTEQQGYFTRQDVRYKFGISKYMAGKLLDDLVSEENPKYRREMIAHGYLYRKVKTD